MTDAARLRYLSVCSGIEAATVAWHPLGWEPAAFSEIEAFPRAVLAHHYPDVPNWGDMTKFKEWPDADVDVLVGGTPCQSFSVAGLRKGMDDPRGNLALTYLAIAARYRPQWLVWENVPGVLSSNGGRDFGSILGGMVELGYGIAYRVLDAQYFRVPQRRRRVFVVGYLGDWRRAAAVLFERESLLGNPPPRREAGKVALTIPSRSSAGGGLGTDFIAQPLPFDTTQITSKANYSNPQPGDPSHPLAAGAHAPAVAFDLRGREGGAQFEGPHDTANIRAAVRRLTPRECERLQGFPDDYTLVPYRGKPASDGPRYKALGNSMAVPCMRWLGERIQMVEALT